MKWRRSPSFNAFVDKISTVMLDVRAGVGSMSTATSEIDMGNRDLSQRTETSAGSLEETSAALTQLTSSVKQTAETAEQATRLATEASAAAERGGQVVSDAVHTMGAISQSSERITEIISVIDGIAFQTNILALNAAVEAARAPASRAVASRWWPARCARWPSAAPPRRRRSRR